MKEAQENKFAKIIGGWGRHWLLESLFACSNNTMTLPIEVSTRVHLAKSNIWCLQWWLLLCCQLSWPLSSSTMTGTRFQRWGKQIKDQMEAATGRQVLSDVWRWVISSKWACIPVGGYRCVWKVSRQRGPIPGEGLWTEFRIPLEKAKILSFLWTVSET